MPTTILCKKPGYHQRGRFIKWPELNIFAFSMILICFFFFDGASLRTLGCYERSEKGFQSVPLPSRQVWWEWHNQPIKKSRERRFVKEKPPVRPPPSILMGLPYKRHNIPALAFPINSGTCQLSQYGNWVGWWPQSQNSENIRPPFVPPPKITQILGSTGQYRYIRTP